MPKKEEEKFTVVRVALAPTKEQARLFASSAGEARVVYNWCLNKVSELRDSGEKKLPGYFTLQALWREARDNDPQYEWARKTPGKGLPNGGTVHLVAAQNAHIAWVNFFKSRKGSRKGPAMGRPKFKVKFKSRRSFGAGIKLGSKSAPFGFPDDYHVNLGTIGTVKLCESIAKRIRRPIERGAIIAIKPLATIAQDSNGLWYIAIKCQIPNAPERHRPTPKQESGGGVGIDFGLSSLAIMSTGRKIPRLKDFAPEQFTRVEQQIYGLQKKLSRQRLAQEREGREEKSAAYLRTKARLAKAHARKANLRENFLHRFTTWLVRSHEMAAIEDLNVKGMARNKRLAKHILDASWGEVRRMLEYKSERDGGFDLHIIDRWHPSTQLCSRCGTKRDPKVTLPERTFICSNKDCLLEIDRDLNASYNIYDEAIRQMKA